MKETVKRPVILQYFPIDYLEFYHTTRNQILDFQIKVVSVQYDNSTIIRQTTGKNTT